MVAYTRDGEEVEKEDVRPVPQGTGPVCFLQFDDGQMLTIQLLASLVPKTAENFQALCTGEVVLDGKRLCYRHSKLHRIVKGMFLQGGDYTAGNGTGGRSIYQRSDGADMWGNFKDEYFSTFHEAGLLSMANKGPNTNGSQFLITTASAPHLNSKYVVFGKVLDGIELVFKIEQVPVDECQRPIRPITIQDCREIRHDATKICASLWYANTESTADAPPFMGMPLLSAATATSSLVGDMGSRGSSCFGSRGQSQGTSVVGASISNYQQASNPLEIISLNSIFGPQQRQQGVLYGTGRTQPNAFCGQEGAQDKNSATRFSSIPTENTSAPSVYSGVQQALSSSSGQLSQQSVIKQLVTSTSPSECTKPKRSNEPYVFGGKALRKACTDQKSIKSGMDTQSVSLLPTAKQQPMQTPPHTKSLFPATTPEESPGGLPATKGQMLYFQTRYAKWKSTPRKWPPEPHSADRSLDESFVPVFTDHSPGAATHNNAVCRPVFDKALPTAKSTTFAAATSPFLVVLASLKPGLSGSITQTTTIGFDFGRERVLCVNGSKAPSQLSDAKGQTQTKPVAANSA